CTQSHYNDVITQGTDGKITVTKVWKCDQWTPTYTVTTYSRNGLFQDAASDGKVTTDGLHTFIMNRFDKNGDDKLSVKRFLFWETGGEEEFQKAYGERKHSETYYG